MAILKIALFLYGEVSFPFSHSFDRSIPMRLYQKLEKWPYIYNNCCSLDTRDYWLPRYILLCITILSPYSSLFILVLLSILAWPNLWRTIWSQKASEIIHLGIIASLITSTLRPSIATISFCHNQFIYQSFPS